MSQFYLQDSRSHVGDGLTFHGKEHRGYYTDLDKCELYTLERATGHRDTDIPWPKDYIDARAHYGVDCQLMDEAASDAMLVHGCRVYVQVPGDWNGNDVFWIGWNKGQVTADLGRACNLNLDQSRIEFAADLATGLRKLWSADYIDTIRRRLVWRQNVDIKQALRGTGIKLVKPRPPREMVFNCTGCGRFVSDRQRFQFDCRNCGQDNRP
ncbi:hypothetical protein JTA33_00345 [Pseudomonas sp. 20GA0080]|uniref:hypothetical protein n=1 Tax=Pseudomonas alliivorans TaxID=2810613 RepID=UPI001AE555AB|nr:hypothetical protein [Pseudomonas alliivorans]MBP0948897.1 hypothetical protein [Pseudomonas alliivorans]